MVYVYFSDKHNNLGDILNGYLIKQMGFKYKIVNPRYYFRKHLFMIGSVVQDANKGSIILGSGLIQEEFSNSLNYGCIYFVRGGLTSKKLALFEKMSFQYLTDPAWLLPLYYKPNVMKSGKTGIVPHYVDKDRLPSWIGNSESFKIIDIQTNDIENTLRQIISCDKIISSSLHGLILADAYGIPNCWVKLSESVQGDGFKFKDYFSTVGRQDIAFELKADSGQEDLNELTFSLGNFSKQLELKNVILKAIQDEFVNVSS